MFLTPTWFSTYDDSLRAEFTGRIVAGYVPTRTVKRAEESDVMIGFNTVQ